MIQFDPVTYTVTEGGSTMLRIVRVGDADIPVSANVSTLVGTAGNRVYVLWHSKLFGSLRQA